ncbi:hypothetical protein [Mycolicibacterium iranicum]|uniref:hypothetical protein n=1 Tax=Mycolicibacterium iranicum TaxID=912594 RepID=UPI0004673953|nr:hypothetical protein [Mycolicibacterium iranicum]
MSNDEETSPVQAVWDAMMRSVDFYDGPLTDAQSGAVMYAIAAITDGPPEAMFGEYFKTGREGDVVYRFYWAKGGSFGCAEVLRPAEMDGAPPVVRGWVRPLSKVAKVDVGSKVDRYPVVRSEHAVKMRIDIHWDGGDEAVVLDGTGSMTTYSRPELEKLIRFVLDRVS